jgi:hypothetical protein
MYKVLAKHLRNHGVRGALSLLKLGLQSTIGDAVVYCAALAIALHNGDRKGNLRKDLLRRTIFPVGIEHFPILGLFLYCDAVQEWNRTPDSRDELVNIDLKGNAVTFTVHFGSAVSSMYKGREFGTVDKCLRLKGIKFGFAQSFFIGQP